MKYHLISALLLVAAALLYLAGMSGGGILLFAAGAGCEVWFPDAPHSRHGTPAPYA